MATVDSIKVVVRSSFQCRAGNQKCCEPFPVRGPPTPPPCSISPDTRPGNGLGGFALRPGRSVHRVVQRTLGARLWSLRRFVERVDQFVPPYPVSGSPATLRSPGRLSYLNGPPERAKSHLPNEQEITLTIQVLEEALRKGATDW